MVYQAEADWAGCLYGSGCRLAYMPLQRPIIVESSAGRRFFHTKTPTMRAFNCMDAAALSGSAFKKQIDGGKGKVWTN